MENIYSSRLRNLPSRTTGRLLNENVINSEIGSNLPSNPDVFDPLLNTIRSNIEKKSCKKCGSRCDVSYKKGGKVFLSCINCQWVCFACPFCSKCFTKFQTVCSHCETTHQNSSKCPFCAEVLALSVYDRISHGAKHISRRLNVQATMDVGNDESNDNEEAETVLPHRLQEQSFHQPLLFSQENPPQDSSQEYHEYARYRSDGCPDNRNHELNSLEVDDSPDDITMITPSQEAPIDDSPGDYIPSQETPTTVDKKNTCVDEEEESEVVHDKRRYLHLKSLLEEFTFKRSSKEGFPGIVIHPLKPKKDGDFDVFYNLPNLKLIQFSKRSHLSEERLQELVDLLHFEFRSPHSFYSAETLTRKVQSLGSANGIRNKVLDCDKGHKVAIIPIEEGLKRAFSDEDFLLNFHVREWPIGEYDPFLHYRQGEKFILESRRVRRSGSHYLSIVSNRDSFPGLMTSMMPIKGYYYNIGNVDYPENCRHVILFAFGLECKSCMHMVEKDFSANINRLSQQPFLLYHPILESYVVLMAGLDVESDDSPQVAENTMSKGVTARNFCSQCGEHMNNYTNPNTYRRCIRKKLDETEILFQRAKRMSQSARHGDGTLTAIHKIELENGRTFTEKKYDGQRGQFITVMKNPTAFFDLDDYTKRNMANPPGPFHSILKGFVLHVKDAVKEKITNISAASIQTRWLEISFPEEVKKPKNVWNVGGNNFDGIEALVHGFPSAIATVVPKNLSVSIRKAFRSISALLHPAYSKLQLRDKKKDFFEAVPVIAQYIDIEFPTTHQTFHVWDRVIPPRADDIPDLSVTDHSLPPPDGPILGEMGKIVGLGPTRNWDEKKFEIFHKRFKKTMRHCNLKNSSLYLVRNYIGEEHLKLFFPEKKWSWFSPHVRYIPFRDASISLFSKMGMMEYLGIGAFEVSEVEFVRVKTLQINTKKYKEGYKMLVDGDIGSVRSMTYVCWSDGFEFEESEILVIIVIAGSTNEKIHRVGSVRGKPFLKGRKLIGVTC